MDLLDEAAERPAGFDLAAHRAEPARRLEAERHRAEARLRLPPRGARRLPVQFGAVGSRALADAGPPDQEGWMEVTLPVETTTAVTDLLRLGTEAEVLGPPELRAALAETVATLARRYGRAG